MMSGSAEGAVCKVQVKRQIRGIVKDLESILGDLKDVAKELKEVVHDIDCLTSDLHLEEEMTDGSKTDTLNSSSSNTTSSTDKIQIYPEDNLFRPPPTILTVVKRPNPPLPPPRMTPSRAEDHSIALSSGKLARANGTLVRNGGFPTKPINVSSRELCCGAKSVTEKELALVPLLRHEKSPCAQTTRERVRFSEKVQYHGYCPDCDLQYDINNTDLHLHTELIDARLSPVHQCSSSSSSSAAAPVLMENGSLGVLPITAQPSQKPHKTILRKSTTTTV